MNENLTDISVSPGLLPSRPEDSYIPPITSSPLLDNIVEKRDFDRDRYRERSQRIAKELAEQSEEVADAISKEQNYNRQQDNYLKKNLKGIEHANCLSSPEFLGELEKRPKMRAAVAKASAIVFGFILLGVILATFIMIVVPEYTDAFPMAEDLAVPLAIGAALIAYKVGDKYAETVIKKTKMREQREMCDSRSASYDSYL